MVIEFDAWSADLLHGRRWHWSQAIDELPGGQIRMRMRLNNIEDPLGRDRGIHSVPPFFQDLQRGLCRARIRGHDHGLFSSGRRERRRKNAAKKKRQEKEDLEFLREHVKTTFLAHLT